MFRASKRIGLALVAAALSLTACGPDRLSSPLTPSTDGIAIVESAGLITSPSGVVFLADEWKALEDKTPYMVSSGKWEEQHSTPNMRMAYSVTGQAGPKVLCYTYASVCNYIPTLFPGATVVFWNDTQWLAATTAQFKQFDVIYLHDAFGGLTALAPIKNTWGAAITGRAIITGTHFDNHCSGNAAAGPCIALKAALTWVHAGTGTGLLVSTQTRPNSANVMIPTIAPFNGITYASNGGGYDLVHITEPGHATMQGSTDASLSNFGNSSHSIFATIGSFTSVASICTIDVYYPNPCPANGQMVPYYLVTSVGIADQDGDGVPDSSDNCPTVGNANQADANGNGVGDACESAPSVVISPENATVALNASVTFTTTVSDADNALNTLRYEWRVNGIIQSNTTSTFTYVAAAGATIRVTVRDPGELSGFDEAKVVVITDATPPVVIPIVTGTPRTNGWYTSNVGVSWSVTDAESAVTSPACTASSVTTDTNGDTFTCSATSSGGTSTGSVTIKRDATKPVVAYSGNEGVYTLDQNVSISCLATDGLSGIDSDSCAPISGLAYTFGLGSHSYSASAMDKAGNSSTATTSFVVIATPASLCTLTKQFVSGPGEKGIENSMCTKLEKGSYAAYINEVEAQSGKSISAAHAALLIGWAATL